MKPRFPLSTKIFLLAFANIALLALVFLVFAKVQFRLELSSLLFGPARDRVISLARQMALDLEETPASGRDELLERYSRTYGVRFFLFATPGTQIGGPAVELPDVVAEELRKPPPREHRGPEDGPPSPHDGRRPPPPHALGPERQPPVFELSTSDPSLYWVGAGLPIRERGSEEQEPGTLLMSSKSFLGTPLFFDYKPWLEVTGAVIIVFVLCWLPLIRSLTLSITRMSKATEQIAEGRFEIHLAEHRRDELGLLADGINRMAERLSGFVTGQKRFLGDIAHELCAPIARMQFALGVLENKTEPGAIDDVQDEVRQISELVEELLSFSKTGMEQRHKTLGPVDVAKSLQQAVAREGMTLEPVVEPGLMAIGDSEYLVRSVSNLLRNASRYAGDAGPVLVSARRDHNEVSITVSDSGPGLPADEVDRVFTPFYRLENSRNRASGGVGLGLAIVRSCVEACKGTVRCRNRVPSGLEVEIRLQAAG